MAGNKNPWRDIVSSTDWQFINTQAVAARQVRARAVAVGGTASIIRNAPARVLIGSARTPEALLSTLGLYIASYGAIAKDDAVKFPERVTKLKEIARLCTQYLTSIDGLVPGVKTGGSKQVTDSIDVWVGSIGRRALKKAAYLETMADWHKNAKPKYKDRLQLSLFLRALAQTNTRDGGEKLHTTPYATIEKIDPLHRQTFVFLDPNDSSGDRSVNKMGEAFLQYLAGDVASTTQPGANTDASFYEWLEYHPFCIGTPGVTAGAMDYKDQVRRISYSDHDLGFVYVDANQMSYERINTHGGNRSILNSSDFKRSGKGSPGAVAFVWDADSYLWLHEHGSQGFVHASAKQGRKIRCSGMVVVQNGLLTEVSNESGHYQPTSANIFQFLDWLSRKNCLASAFDVRITHADVVPVGKYRGLEFLQWFRTTGKAAPLLPHPDRRP